MLAEAIPDLDQNFLGPDIVRDGSASFDSFDAKVMVLYNQIKVRG